MSGFGFVEFLSRSTQAECRELGQLILALADSPRDAAWRVNMDIVRAKVREPEQDDLVAHFNKVKNTTLAFRDALHRDGLAHSQLIAGELSRRGVSQSPSDYLREKLGPQGYADSDVDEALKPLFR